MLTAVSENHRVPGEEVYLIYGGMSGKTLRAEREWMGRSQPGVSMGAERGRAAGPGNSMCKGSVMGKGADEE